MLVNDLQLKLDVLQKTLEKKRQNTKFIDTTSSAYNSLSATTAAAMATTPTQLNSPVDLISSNLALNTNTNSDVFLSDMLPSNAANSTLISNTVTRKPSLNGASNLSSEISNTTKQFTNDNNTRVDSTLNGDSKIALNIDEHNTQLTSSNSISTEDSSNNNSPTISSSSSSMSSSSSTSPTSSSSHQQIDANGKSELTNLITPIKIHKLSKSGDDSIKGEKNENLIIENSKDSNNGR